VAPLPLNSPAGLFSQFFIENNKCSSAATN
jgi:hypothetical protein